MGTKTVGKFVLDTSNPITVIAGGNIPFASHKTTCGVSANGNNAVSIDRCGLYLVLFNATMETTSVLDVNLQLLENGIARQGAHGIATPTAVGNKVNIAFSDVISVCDCGSTIAVRTLNETSVMISNFTVIKIA